nr:MAG TPA: hypothetical protein [Caudoviricetes sp.]
MAQDSIERIQFYMNAEACPFPLQFYRRFPKAG